MPSPDHNPNILKDFSALSVREQRKIMGHLSGMEKIQLDALIKQKEVPDKSPDSDEDEKNSALSLFSPWLVNCLTSVIEDTNFQLGGTVTSDAKNAILIALEEDYPALPNEPNYHPQNSKRLLRRRRRG